MPTFKNIWVFEKKTPLCVCVCVIQPDYSSGEINKNKKTENILRTKIIY